MSNPIFSLVRNFGGLMEFEEPVNLAALGMV